MTELGNSSKKRFISHAPPPPHVVRGSYVPRSSKCSLPPDSLPAYYPTSLVAATDLIILEAIEKFPLQSDVVDLCKCVVAELTPLLSGSIKSGELRQSLALGRVSELIRLLVVQNCEHHSREYELENEVRSSKEWALLVKAIANTGGVSRQCYPQIPVTEKPQAKAKQIEDCTKAAPRVESDDVKPGHDLARAKRKVKDPSQYPSMTCREVMAILELKKSAVYDHKMLDLVSTGTRKKLFTTASVKAVIDSSPE